MINHSFRMTTNSSSSSLKNFFARLGHSIEEEENKRKEAERNVGSSSSNQLQHQPQHQPLSLPPPPPPPQATTLPQTLPSFLPGLTGPAYHRAWSAAYMQAAATAAAAFAPAPGADFLLREGPAAFLAARRSRHHTTFTHDQKLSLEAEFLSSAYPSRPRRSQLAESLDVTETSIKNWFQNRRVRDKRGGSSRRRSKAASTVELL